MARDTAIAAEAHPAHAILIGVPLVIVYVIIGLAFFWLG